MSHFQYLALETLALEGFPRMLVLMSTKGGMREEIILEYVGNERVHIVDCENLPCRRCVCHKHEKSQA